MASETRIKVKSPLVELDGDEVRVPFYSSKVSIGRFHKPASPHARLAHYRLENAGKYGDHI